MGQKQRFFDNRGANRPQAVLLYAQAALYLPPGFARQLGWWVVSEEGDSTARATLA